MVLYPVAQRMPNMSASKHQFADQTLVARNQGELHDVMR